MRAGGVQAKYKELDFGPLDFPFAPSEALLRFVLAHATCGDTEVASQHHLSNGGLGAGAGAGAGAPGMDSVEQQEQRRQDAGAKMRHAAEDRLAYKQARGLAPAGTKAAPARDDRKAGHGSVGEKRGAGRSKQGGCVPAPSLPSGPRRGPGARPSPRPRPRRGPRRVGPGRCRMTGAMTRTASGGAAGGLTRDRVQPAELHRRRGERLQGGRPAQPPPLRREGPRGVEGGRP